MKPDAQRTYVAIGHLRRKDRAKVVQLVRELSGTRQATCAERFCRTVFKVPAYTQGARRLYCSDLCKVREWRRRTT